MDSFFCASSSSQRVRETVCRERMKEDFEQHAFQVNVFGQAFQFGIDFVRLILDFTSWAEFNSHRYVVATHPSNGFPVWNNDHSTWIRVAWSLFHRGDRKSTR